MRAGDILGILVGLCLTVGAVGAQAQGQDADGTPPRITGFDLETSDAYGAVTRFSRLQRDLIYIDRLTGEIPMDGAPPYEPPETETAEAPSETPVNVSRALLILALIAVVVLVVTRGGLLRDLRAPRNPQRIRQTSADTSAAPGAQPEVGLLARLRHAADPEAAIVELIEALLPAAAQQNDMRVGRSETARDLLRRLPRSWPHLRDLRMIVMAEELVQFGGRPLARDTWDDCLARAGRILGEQPQ